MVYVDVSNQNLKSLRDVDWSKYGHVTMLNCGWNQLTSLIGCPPSVKVLYCSENQLTSLIGCPASVTYLYCNENQLTSLIGCPASVTVLHCYGNQLTSLIGCPASVTYLHCYENPLALGWGNLRADQVHAKNRHRILRRRAATWIVLRRFLIPDIVRNVVIQIITN